MRIKSSVIVSLEAFKKYYVMHTFTPSLHTQTFAFRRSLGMHISQFDGRIFCQQLYD